MEFVKNVLAGLGVISNQKNSLKNNTLLPSRKSKLEDAIGGDELSIFDTEQLAEEIDDNFSVTSTEDVTGNDPNFLKFESLSETSEEDANFGELENGPDDLNLSSELLPDQKDISFSETSFDDYTEIDGPVKVDNAEITTANVENTQKHDLNKVINDLQGLLKK